MIVLTAMPFSRALLLATAAAAALAVPGAAGAAVAPGAVVFPFDAAATVRSVDVFAPVAPAVLPDGGVVLAGRTTTGLGLTVAALRRDGSPDPAFGTGGIARFAVGHASQIVQTLRRPDGRLLVVFAGRAYASWETDELHVAQLTPAGVLDRSFGSDGVATPGIEVAYGQPTTAAVLRPDGSLLVGGGRYLPPADPGTPTSIAVVARLTPDGQPDPTYGRGGVTEVSGSGRGATYALAATPDGGVAAVGTAADGSGTLTHLTADGLGDPAFDHGAPVALPGPSSQVVAHADGSIDVLAQWRVLRYSATGVRDTSFGGPDGAQAVAGTENTLLLARPDGGDVALALNFEGQGSARVIAVLVHPDGTADPARALDTPFGGGFFSPPAAATLQKTATPTYRPETAAVRPDGTLLVAGGVNAKTYTGEGSGFEHEEAAVASYGADLAPDPAFGGPRAAPVVSVRPTRYRTYAASHHRGLSLVVRLAASATGLADVRVRSGGQTVAQATVPVRVTGIQDVVVPLTRQGLRALASGRRRPATVSARFRDFLGGTAAATGTGVVR